MRRAYQLTVLLTAVSCGTVVKNPKAPPAPLSSVDLSEISSAVFDELAESLASPGASVPPLVASTAAAGASGFTCASAERGVATRFAVDRAISSAYEQAGVTYDHRLADKQTHTHRWTSDAGAITCGPDGRLNQSWSALKGASLAYDFTVDSSASVIAGAAGPLFTRNWVASGSRTFTVSSVAEDDTTVATSFSLASDVKRRSASIIGGETPLVDIESLTTIAALTGESRYRRSDSAVASRTVSAGSWNVKLAGDQALTVTFSGLRYAPGPSAACLPIEGTALFESEGLAWTLDFSQGLTAIASDGREIRLRPGFCVP